MNLLETIFGVASLAELFNNMILGFIAGIINSILGWFDGLLLNNLLKGMLTVEKSFSTGAIDLGTTQSAASGFVNLNGMYTFIYGFCCALVALKFLTKGFKIYILWRDGDADNSPQDMLIGVGQAVVMMVSFPLLYEYMSSITLYFAGELLGYAGGFGQSGTVSLGIETALAQSQDLAFVFLLLIYLIILLVLWVKMLVRGVELLILRLGVPFACLCLIDSDMGLFKGYMQIFFKTLMTSVIQVVLISMSLKVLTTLKMGNILLAFAMLQMAFKTPVLLQQILIQTGGGGGGLTSKIYTGSMAVNGIRTLLAKK